MHINEITQQIIAAGITVHKALGPGLLESAYQKVFAIELNERGLLVQREVPLSIVYKTGHIKCAYRMDVLVENKVVVELKAVSKLEEVHTAQMITHLKLSGCKVGLILNFNVPILSRGIRRVVLGFSEPQRPLRLRGE